MSPHQSTSYFSPQLIMQLSASADPEVIIPSPEWDPASDSGSIEYRFAFIQRFILHFR
jgi:hypothetical protein